MTRPERWLRRCNGKPVAGIPMSQAGVEIATRPQPGTAVSGDLATGFAVYLPARRPWEVEQGGTCDRTFTYTPVCPEPSETR